MMNGHIEVESEKGKGTAFTVTVTLDDSERQGGEAENEGVVYSHAYTPCMSFRVAVVCMGIMVIVLGCCAGPLMALLTKSIALL